MRASLNFTLPAQEQEFQAALHGLRNGTLSTCETVQLRAEIERLRLTEAEREAVAYYIGTGGPHAVDDTLRGLLERLGGER